MFAEGELWIGAECIGVKNRDSFCLNVNDFQHIFLVIN